MNRKIYSKGNVMKQIKSTRIKNFMAVETAELHFAAVNKIVGTNTAGKSSVVQALRFCSQGVVPEYGIDKKNMAPMLAHNGGAMLVEMVTDEGLYTRNASNKGTGVIEDDRLAGVIFDSQSFIEMAAKDRQRLVQQFTASSSSDEIAKLAQSQGFSQEVINKILDNMDAAQKYAIAERQAAGRRIKELEADIAAIPTVTYTSNSGKEVDLSKYTMEQIDGNIKKLDS